MQIQPPGAAAAAAAITTAAPSKEAAPTATGGAQLSPTHVDKSGQANADRDAQGQGDGLGDRHHKKPPEPDELDESTLQQRPAPNLPGEPPSQLDVLG